MEETHQCRPWQLHQTKQNLQFCHWACCAITKGDLWWLPLDNDDYIESTTILLSKRLSFGSRIHFPIQRVTFQYFPRVVSLASLISHSKHSIFPVEWPQPMSRLLPQNLFPNSFLFQLTRFLNCVGSRAVVSHQGSPRKKSSLGSSLLIFSSRFGSFHLGGIFVSIDLWFPRQYQITALALQRSFGVVFCCTQCPVKCVMHYWCVRLHTHKKENGR